ncbi:MAG: VRR-NUC domain-containing protein, partial [Candidatus Desulforudis sp.]|nr:VRR-NUC domain-containing protein [Desulforudis sp.]
AEYWFKRRGWQMFKIEPPVKNLGPIPGKPGHFEAVYTDSGMPDFFGFRKADNQAMFVEVKEARGKSCPASRLSAEQRAFMAALPDCMRFTGILWDDCFEIFPFTPRGSYQKGHGFK